MQKHHKVKKVFDGTGPFGTEDKRNDAQLPGPTGPRSKARAAAMRRPPFAAKKA